MSKIEKACTVMGHAVGHVVLGKSAKKGTEQIEFYYEVTKGEHAGEKVRWTGYFGEKSAKRTVEALQICGWEGDDLSEFADGELHGLDTNEVALVIEIEEYEAKVRDENGEPTDETEIRRTPRVQWVNDPNRAGFLNVENAMKPEEASSFGERMKALVLKSKSKMGPKKADTSANFPHGANAPAALPATGTGGRRF